MLLPKEVLCFSVMLQCFTEEQLRLKIIVIEKLEAKILKVCRLVVSKGVMYLYDYVLL